MSTVGLIVAMYFSWIYLRPCLRAKTMKSAIACAALASPASIRDAKCCGRKCVALKWLSPIEGDA
ncbi:hypothetical protein U2054_15695, partial [Listeria monocytogenes]|uniref:hypothetical protein n=1 Tax=Listeria monocytogenes TaxID=1639 RepID=UPI002FDBEC40